MGLALGLALATVLAIGNGGLPRLFTGDAAVLAAVGHIFPWVILSQPINALAFVWDGILYGAGGFSYAAKVRLPAFMHCDLLHLPTAYGHAGSLSVSPRPMAAPLSLALKTSQVLLHAVAAQPGQLCSLYAAMQSQDRSLLPEISYLRLKASRTCQNFLM